MKNIGIYRILWYAVLVTLIGLALVVFYVIDPVGNSPEEPAVSMVVILGIVGLVVAIAGARLARGVFLPGWTSKSRIARLLRSMGDGDMVEPSLAVFVIGLALIESTAVIALVLYIFSGYFNAYILLTGIALVGWVVARPETGAEPPADAETAPWQSESTDK